MPSPVSVFPAPAVGVVVPIYLLPQPPLVPAPSVVDVLWQPLHLESVTPVEPVASLRFRSLAVDYER